MELDRAGETFYRSGIGALQQAGIPFLVGGAYALEWHAGIVRRTKDLDLFVKADQIQAALDTLQQAGYRTEFTFPHWLGKAFCADHFIDVIFNSGNGVCPVDDDWFRFSLPGRIFEMDVRLCPIEETIWQKAFVLERDRCDTADVAHLLRCEGTGLDWQRLLARFGPRWRALLAQLVLFEFVYPSHRDNVPDWVLNELSHRLLSARSQPAEVERECHGTLLSATQYLKDIDLEGYRDARLAPAGPLSREHVAIWTANFMKPG